MPTAAPLSTPVLAIAALALGSLAAIFGLSWPARPRLTGTRRRTLWIAVALVVAFAVLMAFGRWSLLPAGAVLIFLALTDLRRFSLPLPGLALLGLAVALDLALHPLAAWHRLLTGAAVLLAFLALRQLSGKPPRLGFGDVLLAGLAATLIGWRLAPLAFALAALAPLALQRLTGRTGPVPFGFWLSLATLITGGLSAG
ncbi:MAG: prepilin peptidase [Caulobacter sp.]|nr:prepilin peptidase [Caulobacter sp.]